MSWIKKCSRPSKSGPLGLRLAATLVAAGLALTGAFVAADRWLGTARPALRVLEQTADGRPLTPLPDPAAYPPAAEVPAADPRELEFIGAADDPDRFLLVEAGEIATPALVWFHSAWCSVCQAIRPSVVELGEAYHGRVAVVRVSVDNPANFDLVRKYQVRGTPTFVLFGPDGAPLGALLGWPGYEGFADTFDTLLAARPL